MESSGCRRWRLRRKLPQNIVDGRRAICTIIADIPPNSPCGDASSTLEPLVGDIISSCAGDCSAEIGASGDEDCVTPLMVACEKSQLGCLQFIERKMSEIGDSDKRQTMIALMGHPLDRCSDDCGGNSAAHLAASSGFAQGVDLLTAILEELSSTDDSTDLMDEVKVFWDNDEGWDRQSQATHNKCVSSFERQAIYLAILAAGNAHNDTPLMIASATGHATFLKHMLRKTYLDASVSGKLLLPPNIKSDDVTRVRGIFNAKNDSGDTALSLACGQGHSDVVEVLINSLVEVSYDDVQKCKAIVAKTNEALNLMRQNGHTDVVYDKRAKNVRRCLVMLQVKQAQIAQKNMEDLLGEENHKGVLEEDRVLGRRRKKKNTARHSKKSSLHPSESTKCKQNESLSKMYSQESMGPHSGQWCGADKGDIVSPPAVSEEEMPITDMHIDRIGHGNTSNGEESEAAVKFEAEMDSLCLDASMLLLTPHGMAMKLSPSQLDVVENVLENQLAAVQEAREIQGRLLSHSKVNVS